MNNTNVIIRLFLLRGFPIPAESIITVYFMLRYSTMNQIYPYILDKYFMNYDDPWFLANEQPPKTGRYLVVQQTEDYKKYRWIRYWDGAQWCNASLEKYGPVTHWAHLKDLP